MKPRMPSDSINIDAFELAEIKIRVAAWIDAVFHIRPFIARTYVGIAGPSAQTAVWKQNADATKAVIAKPVPGPR